MGNKIENIQALRGIAVLLVVMFHIAVVEQLYGHGDVLLADYLTGAAASVDLFFIISGFIMVTVSRGWFHRSEKIADFVYHRITRIYPLYWFYTILTLSIYLFLPQVVNDSNRLDHHSILASFLLFPQYDLPLVVVGWTLVHEMYFYSVFTILLFFPEKYFVKLLLAWGFLVVVGDTSIQHGLVLRSTPLTTLITHLQTLEFIAGCLIAKLIYSGRHVQGVRFVILGVALLLINLFLYAPESLIDIPQRWLRIALFGIPCVFIAYGAVAMEMESGIVFNRFFRLNGDASYSIYLSHVMVVAAIGKLWFVVGVPGYVDNVLAILGMIVTVILVGLASYWLLERPLLLLSRQVRLRAAGPSRAN